MVIPCGSSHTSPVPGTFETKDCGCKEGKIKTGPEIGQHGSKKDFECTDCGFLAMWDQHLCPLRGSRVEMNLWVKHPCICLPNSAATGHNHILATVCVWFSIRQNTFWIMNTWNSIIVCREKGVILTDAGTSIPIIPTFLMPREVIVSSGARIGQEFSCCSSHRLGCLVHVSCINHQKRQDRRCC